MHGPGVGLRAEAERHHLAVKLDGDGDGGGGLADGVTQQVSGIRGGRELVLLGTSVQADNGVEVDDTARLLLSDLDEPDAYPAEQGLLGYPSEAGQVPGQVGDEPAPQIPRVGVEQHG